MTEQRFALLVTSLSHFRLFEAWNSHKVSSGEPPIYVLTNKLLAERAPMLEVVFARKCDIRADL